MSRKLTVVALVSMTLVALELGWTRIFSAEFFYTFAFLILSLAVMGLGFASGEVHRLLGQERPGLDRGVAKEIRPLMES